MTVQWTPRDRELSRYVEDYAPRYKKAWEPGWGFFLGIAAAIVLLMGIFNSWHVTRTIR
jgi:uncharacterized oligopeptide transporter (OPT) family protein